MTRKLFQSLAAALPLLLAAADAHAWVPLDGGDPTWASMPVTYKVNTGSIPGSIASIAVARVDAGFSTWASPSCTFFEAQNGGSTANGSNYNDGVNVIRWQSGSWPAQLGDVNSVIGVTSPVWDNNNQFFDADIVFNNVGFCWDDSGGGCVDTQSIATHEEGHFLGLGHTNASGATMEPFYGGGTSLRSIEQDDIDGVCALYPAGGQAASSSSSGGSNCQTCANASAQGGACSGAYNACGSSQDCVDFFNCIQGCQDQGCVDACANSYPGGVQGYNALIDCLCNDCAAQCATECGGSSSSSSGDTGPTSTSANGAGVGGSSSGPSGAGGAGVGAGSTSWSSDDVDEPKKGGGDPDADSGCAVALGQSSSVGLGALVLVLALGGAASRRRRRRR